MTIFVVQARGTDPAALERARFVREGFSWPAFLLGPLWLLYHLMWLAFVVWVVVEVAFIVLVYPHVSGVTSGAVDALAHLYLGFEGHRLRVAKNARRAALTDVVEARSRDDAEMAFFHDLAAARDQVPT